ALSLCALAIAASAACRREPKRAVAAPPTPVPPPQVRFEEKAAGMGIAFTHINGAAGKKWMPETMGGGVAVLDYDPDGRPDPLFVSSTTWPGDAQSVGGRSPSSLRLYRNEGAGADGLPHFRETTREAGLERTFYGMGAA